MLSVFVIKQHKSSVKNVLKTNLDNAITEYNAENAIGILLESQTGKIIAKYETSPKNAIFNQKYEFGGLLSVINTAIALENGISLDKTYDKITVKDILLKSINSGHNKIATDLPESAQSKFFEKMRFNDVLTIDSEKTIQPDIPKKWTKSERINASLGYGVKITPIHLLFGMNAIVNDGIYVFQKQPSERVFSSKTSSEIREIMQELVKTTLGDKIEHVGIKTASIHSKEAITTALFATFPIENPEYSLLVILEDPKGDNNLASWNVVPLTGKILTQLMPILKK